MLLVGQYWNCHYFTNAYVKYASRIRDLFRFKTYCHAFKYIQINLNIKLYSLTENAPMADQYIPLNFMQTRPRKKKKNKTLHNGKTDNTANCLQKTVPKKT